MATTTTKPRSGSAGSTRRSNGSKRTSPRPASRSRSASSSRTRAASNRRSTADRSSARSNRGSANGNRSSANRNRSSGGSRAGTVAKGAAGVGAAAGTAALGLAVRTIMKRTRRPKVLGVSMPRTSVKLNGLNARKVDLKKVVKQIGDFAERVENASEGVRDASARTKKATRKVA